MRCKMISSPLYSLVSSSGLRAEERDIPLGQSFFPTMLSPDVPIEAPKTEESAVEIYKKAVRERRLEDSLDILDELFVDKPLLVRAILETTVELVNAASPAMVLAIINITHEAMKAETVLQITNLLVRSPARSEEYAEYVSAVMASRSRGRARDAIEGHIEPSGDYAKLATCSTRYWAYPIFVATLPARSEVPVKFARLASRLEKKRKAMEALK